MFTFFIFNGCKNLLDQIYGPSRSQIPLVFRICTSLGSLPSSSQAMLQHSIICSIVTFHCGKLNRVTSIYSKKCFNNLNDSVHYLVLIFITKIQSKTHGQIVPLCSTSSEFEQHIIIPWYSIQCVDKHMNPLLLRYIPSCHSTSCQMINMTS